MKRILLIILLLTVISLSAQDEPTVCYQLFNSPRTFTELTEGAIATYAQAIWAASEMNGNVVTVTGTLQQSTSGNWSYSSTPADKMIIKFANGAQADFSYKNLDGWTKGTWESFTKSHTMDFTAKLYNAFDLHIVSKTWPDEAKKIHWERQTTGSVIYYLQNTQVNLSHNGISSSSVDAGWAETESVEQITGSVTSPIFTADLNHSYWFHMIHNSNSKQFVMNREIKSNSSATSGGSTYKYNNARVRWASGTQFSDSAQAGVYNEMIDVNYWIAEGTMTKNNQNFGNVVFLSQAALPTYGPTLVVDAVDGRRLLIHSLLRYWIGIPTDVKKDGKIISDYTLEQNYPNPFNPSTVISYNVPEEERVLLKIYDMLGKEIRTLVDEEQHPGNYSVSFNAAGLASGTYLYRIQIGNFSEVKKMILLR